MNKEKISIIGLVVIALIVGGLWYTKNKSALTPGKNTEVPVNLYYDTTWTAKYITTTETWPPVVTFQAGQFSCTPGADVVAIRSKMIDGKLYCITTLSEGAAGSVYTTYTYLTPGGADVLAELTFTAKAVQCANYDDPEKTECETERTLFDIDTLAHKVIENSIE